MKSGRRASGGRRAGRPGSGLRGARPGRRFRPSALWVESLLEARITPSVMTLAGGQLTYTAEDGEANKLLVDVTRQGGVDYVRVRETGSVSILVQGDPNGSTGGLVVN